MAQFDLDDDRLADEWAKQADAENKTIADVLSPKAKDDLLKMMKHGEFDLLEETVLKLLLGERLNLEELGLFLGLASQKTGGKPMSKPAVLKTVRNLTNKVALRAQRTLGKKVDLNAIKQVEKLEREQKRIKDAAKKAKMKADKEEEKRLKAEFVQLQNELNAIRREHGLKPQYYNRAYSGQFMGNN